MIRATTKKMDRSVWAVDVLYVREYFDDVLLDRIYHRTRQSARTHAKEITRYGKALDYAINLSYIA